MKKKFLVDDEGKEMAKEFFDVSEKEFVEVGKYMEKEYDNLMGVVVKLNKTKFNERQKMLVCYIVGFSSGANTEVHIVEQSNIPVNSRIENSMYT